MDCYDELGNRYQLPVYILSAPINMIQEGDEEEGIEYEKEDYLKMQERRKNFFDGKQINIRIRFSTGDDCKLTVNTNETVFAVKRALARCSPGIDSNAVRFFFAGKQLYNKTTLASAKVESNYTLQALIVEPSPSRKASFQTISVKSKSTHNQNSSKFHKHKKIDMQQFERKQEPKMATCLGYNSLNKCTGDETIISNNSINSTFDTIPINTLYHLQNETSFNRNIEQQNFLDFQQQNRGIYDSVEESGRYNASIYNVNDQKYGSKLFPQYPPIDTNNLPMVNSL